MRWKVAGKAELITVFAPVPVVGAMPLIFFSTRVPWVSQPNRFLPGVWTHVTPAALGVQLELVHLAEWNFSAMYLPVEKGKIASGSLRTGLTPWFSCRVPPVLLLANVMSWVMPAEEPSGRGMCAQPVFSAMESPIAPVSGFVASQLYRCVAVALTVLL